MTQGAYVHFAVVILRDQNAGRSSRSILQMRPEKI